MKKGLNANTLKVIAITAMTLDHIAWMCFPGYPRAPLPVLLHVLGRLTCPIMCFFIAEGYHHTKNIRKYNLIGAPLGLAYNLSVASVGACCMEVFKIVSILTAMLRLDRDPDSAKEKNNRERNKAS